MKPFEIRLAAEQQKNALHLRNLQAFIANRERFDRLTLDEQTDLCRQAEVMAELDEILTRRLTRRNIPV